MILNLSKYCIRTKIKNIALRRSFYNKYNKQIFGLYNNYKIDDEYVDNYFNNIRTTHKLASLLADNLIELQEISVADDGEIEFDWNIDNKEAIISINIINRYSYLLKQPSGKYLSNSCNVDTLPKEFINYIKK